MLMAQRTKQIKERSKPHYEYFLSWDDFNERKKIWQDYYIQVRTTRAYKRFVEQKDAMRRGDLKKVKELAQEAKKDRLNENWEIAKPKFPDPVIDRRNKKVGIYEWDGSPSNYERAREIFK
jgi:hypothetical protein